MIILLKKYGKSILLGGLLTGAIVLLLSGVSFSIINPAYVSTPLYIAINVLGVVVVWWAIAFLVYRFPLWEVLVIMSLLFVAGVTDQFLDPRDNPITIPLTILFWIGVVYLILPQFFKKYRLPILVVYGLVISYYLVVFGTSARDADSQRWESARAMLVPIPVFAALWIYEQWRWQQSLKADKAKAELALLKSQMNPHFFFNTLNNLYGLVVEQSPQAPEVVLKLSDMMRYTIYEGKEDWVNLADEIQYLEAYIELHKLRQRHQVDIRFMHDVPSGTKVAPLLFIVLLENAFKHGVERLTEGAYIHMNMEVLENRVLFTIQNNFEDHPAYEKGGIGLQNLKQRLDLLYPNRHELLIDQTDYTYSVQLNLMLHPDASV
ncbi:MAG TPA: hypothetical protein DCR93_07310 [Cytophagales bacterium]|nr:hypothetical protein [Cytophagales bacterium]HAP59308.1 hypothetical protein [Cytophagales bacterium]